uniref:Uncharacterized protein n=1 Tax=Anguilla anguilla TaxID=7936 RepID=A0A0E9W1Q8_ANGAN
MQKREKEKERGREQEGERDRERGMEKKERRERGRGRQRCGVLKLHPQHIQKSCTVGGGRRKEEKNQVSKIKKKDLQK